MPPLNERQNDALVELINIAFGHTSAILSDLAKCRVLLEPPQVKVCQASELGSVLIRFLPGEVTFIRQVFSGPIAGDALLLLATEGAVELSSLLTNGHGSPTRLDESAREVLTEVGNILLNGCLSILSNLLQVHLSFSVPHLYLEKFNDLMFSLVDKHESNYALVVFTAFRVKDTEVKGYLVLVLSIGSLDSLLLALDAWEAQQESR